MYDADEKKISSILIVDDEPKNIQLLANILNEKGYEVEFATSGELALEWTASRPFDLILLDIMMEGMDGFQVCQQLKASPETQEIPVIFLTAKAEIKDIVKGFEFGAVDYVMKPFNTIELLVRVNTHLELKANRDFFKKLAITDGLTQLYNHSHIHARLAEEISASKRHQHTLSVVMLDLDHFKKINDDFGHKTGDEVLVRVSGLIKSLLRKEDIAGRYGGEEFMLVLPNTDRQAAFTVAEKIRMNIQDHKWSLKNLTVTVSGGVCMLENEDESSLIMEADRLMYEAKNNGRNQIKAG